MLRHSQKAMKEGFGITLHLDSATRSEIDEFSTSGFLGVKYANGKNADDGCTVVVPDSQNVIKSVTSESACQIAQDMFKWKVERRPILYDELKEYDEIMAAGTAASLVPIKSITMRSKGDEFAYPVGQDDAPGPVCEKLLMTLKGMQQGKVKDQFGWNYEVTEAPKNFAMEGKGIGVNGVNGTAVDTMP